MAHDYFRALRDVALVINSSLEPREVLHKITEQTAVTMGCKASTIRLLDSTGRFLLPSAAHGLSSTYMRKGPVEVKRSGLDGEVLSGKTIHLKDATADGRFQYPESAKAEALFPCCPPPSWLTAKPLASSACTPT
jgi:Signal transduction protein containing GAF and PtsI domains